MTYSVDSIRRPTTHTELLRQNGSVETDQDVKSENPLPKWAPWLLGFVGIAGVVVMILLVR